jgi:hypothetical protein
MKLVPVDPKTIEMVRRGRRGRVSYPILKMFLESASPVSKLDRTGITQSMMSLRGSLNSYIQAHGLPVEMWQSDGEIYLARTDVDDTGNIDPLNNDINKRRSTGSTDSADDYADTDEEAEGAEEE